MTFSNSNDPGQHFRRRYSPAKPQSVPPSQETHQPQHEPPPKANSQPEPQPQPEPEFLPKANSEPEPQTEPLAEPQPLTRELSRLAATQGVQTTAPSPPASTVLALGLLAGATLIGVVLVTKQSTMQASLSWQPSCGSSSTSGSRWWPVLGPAEAVETIRSRYCGDAYVTVYGFAQVASFTSFEEATNFAQRLSRASGYSFRVGETRTP